MKKLPVVLAMLALLGCSMCNFASARTLTDKEALVQRYYWYEELLASANSEDIIAMQTPDFENHWLDGTKMSRDLSDAWLRESSDKIVRVHAANIRINQLNIHKGYAVVVITQYTDMENVAGDGLIYHVVGNLVSRHTWVKNEYGWQIKRAELVRKYAVVNGKVVRL